jgi:recombinational DNA repair protein (RecF pathway)
MLVKTKAIVLHSFKFGESKMIVDMLTEAEGRLSFVVNMPRSSKSKLSALPCFSASTMWVSYTKADMERLKRGDPGFVFFLKRSEQDGNVFSEVL